MHAKRKTCILSWSILTGSALACFFLATYHVGWTLRGIDAADGVALALLAFVMPLGVAILATFNKLARFISLLASMGLFVLGAYVVVLAAPNLVQPSNLQLGAAPMAMYFLMMGCSINGVFLGLSGLLETGSTFPRAGAASWTDFLLGLPVAGITAGVLVAAGVMSGAAGWLSLLLVATMAFPGAVFFNLLVTPMPWKDDTSRPGPSAFKPGMDTSKAAKVLLATAAIGLGTSLLVGINGLDVPAGFYSGVNWAFYLVSGCTMVAGAAMVRGIAGHPAGEGKASRGRVQLATVATLAAGAAMALTGLALEMSVPGYHGSLLGQLASGAFHGFAIGSLLALVVALRPPKQEHAYTGVLVLLLLFLLALGNFIKGIPVRPGEFVEISSYFPYVAVALGLLVAVAVVACVVTMIRPEGSSAIIRVKERQAGRLQGGAQQ